MNTKILPCLLLVCSLVGVCAQGRIAFNNIVNPGPGTAPVTINTASGMFNPADGPAGAWVGSNYSASLLYVPGIVTDQGVFDSLNPVWLGDAIFWGTTGTGSGHGLGGDGAGFFDGGSPIVTGLQGTGVDATFQVLAWYNGVGLYGGYAEALAAGHNVGQSKLISVVITLPPAAIANLNGLQPFTVGIPEPSTAVLAFFGGALLLVFRRRK